MNAKLISEFLRKPARIRRLLIRAMFWSVYYKSVIKNRPFAEYAKKMGTFQYETPFAEISDSRIADVRWVMYAVDRWAPWETKCFDQALTAKKLLNGYGLPCTLYLGVRMDADQQMIAHAWLRCGAVYVSGGDGCGYAATGIYGDQK